CDSTWGRIRVGGGPRLQLSSVADQAPTVSSLGNQKGGSMSSAMTTGAGARKPMGVFALVLVAALWSAFVLSAGAASQLRVAHAAGQSGTRAAASQPRAPRRRLGQRRSRAGPGYLVIQ